MAVAMTDVILRRPRTFQLGFIFSIVIGLGVGEGIFGRYSLIH
jgi:hypothetical protein